MPRQGLHIEQQAYSFAFNFGWLQIYAKFQLMFVSALLGSKQLSFLMFFTPVLLGMQGSLRPPEAILVIFGRRALIFFFCLKALGKI